jgi:hypothetical protein
MRRLTITLLSLAAVAVPSAQACDCGGCPPTSCGASSSASPGSNLLFLRSFGQRGPATAFDVSSGRRTFALPPGVAAANGRIYVSASRSRRAVTFVRTYNARTGRELSRRRLDGRGWTIAGVSANGRYIAVLDAFERRGFTRILVLSRSTGDRVRFALLRGNYDVDAVSNDGERLFLIQYLRNGYLIRLYDAARMALTPKVLTEDGEPMQGLAWDAVASPNGRYLFTLYLRGDGAAEIHTLDLHRGTAICIHLPGGDATGIEQYALALSPDGRALYAANPLLGVVATVDPAKRRVAKVVHFRVAGAPSSPSQLAAVSHGGRTVYFTSGAAVFRYDAAFGVVRGPYTLGRFVAAGLAFTPDDRRLLVVRSDGRVLWLDAASGRRAARR